jgi:tetratricopeptide (TPR) repeat protein
MLSPVLWLVPFLLAAEAPPTDPEAAAIAAEQSGQLEEAFQSYVAALRALPDPPPAEADLRLRGHILQIVRQTGSSLPIPEDARAALAKGRKLAEAHEALGSGGDVGGLEAAAAGFRQAVRLAPWWPEPILEYARLLQKLKQYEAAAANLELYRLLQPEAVESPAAPAPAPAAAGAATVYVYWPRQFAGSGNPNRLQCNGRVVAKLQKGRFVPLTLAPGAYTLDFGEKVSSEFAAGQEYYVRATYGGFPKSKKLRLASREEAKAEMEKDRMTPGDADHVFDLRCGAGAASSR